MPYPRNLRPAVLLSLAFALRILPAWAEQAEPKDGLPQLDVSLFPGQLFWLAVTFLVLYLLMSGVALPRIARTQLNRRRVIDEELAAAHAASDAAREATAQVDALLKGARAKAQADVSEIVAEAAKQAAATRLAQEKEMARELRRAEAEIALSRENALAAVASGAAALAKTVVEMIVGSKSRRQA